MVKMDVVSRLLKDRLLGHVTDDEVANVLVA
jgi:hypothetical protein